MTTSSNRPASSFRCRALQAALLLMPGLTACSVQTNEPSSEDDARAPIGKADLVDGSCFELGHTDHCGGQSDGTCFCDEQCVEFGDCCFDALWCEDTGALPCGGIFTDACPDGFQCLADEEPACDPEQTTSCPGTCQPVQEDDASGAPCGGLVSDSCPDGEVCEPLPDFDCDPEQTTSCPGTCQ